jgi:hypothetical protein
MVRDGPGWGDDGLCWCGGVVLTYWMKRVSRTGMGRGGVDRSSSSDMFSVSGM